MFNEAELMLNWDERDKGKWDWLCKVYLCMRGNTDEYMLQVAIHRRRSSIPRGKATKKAISLIRRRVNYYASRLRGASEPSLLRAQKKRDYAQSLAIARESFPMTAKMEDASPEEETGLPEESVVLGEREEDASDPVERESDEPSTDLGIAISQSLGL